ncbi:MAG: site-specific integrase [Phycisphaeraceae bacterium]|nr:site-specific integrase [Phycisphaeraceae bacterium]
MRQPYLSVDNKTTKTGPVEYWTIRFWDGAGKKRSKSLGRTKKSDPQRGLNKTEAKRELARLAVSFERDPLKRDCSRVTIAELWKQYKAVRGPELAEGTLTLYETSIGYLQAHFGKDCPVGRITAAKAGGFKASLSEGRLSTRSINAVTLSIHMRALNSIWNFCSKSLRIIHANPFAGLSQTIKVSKKWHYAGLGELDVLLGVATEKFWLMIVLCRLAGLRRMEAYFLEWEDVNFEKGRLYVVGKPHWQPKDRETRCVPICPQLMAILTKAFDDAPEKAVRICPAVNVKNIDRDIKATIKRAGIAPHLKPLHCLRKSALTDWASWLPIHAVKEFGGHEDIKTLEQYYLRVGDDLYDRVTVGQAKNVPENEPENEKRVTTPESSNT